MRTQFSPSKIWNFEDFIIKFRSCNMPKNLPYIWFDKAIWCHWKNKLYLLLKFWRTKIQSKHFIRLLVLKVWLLIHVSIMKSWLLLSPIFCTLFFLCCGRNLSFLSFQSFPLVFYFWVFFIELGFSRHCDPVLVRISPFPFPLFFGGKEPFFIQISIFGQVGRTWIFEQLLF